MPRKLKDWISSYAEFTKNSESPASYHTWAGLSCIASALQRKVHIQWGHSTIFPNLYVVIVGPSGQSRKGEPVTVARSFIEELNIPIISEDNSQEAVILDMKMSATTFQGKDGRIKTQSAVCCFAEELAVFTGYQHSTFLAYLTNWYDSRDKWTRRTKHQGTDEIIGMCFNLFAATAPDWIPHILTREAIGGGFTSRVIFIVETGKEQTISNPNLYPPDEQLREELTTDLEHIHTLVGEFKFSEDALDLYTEWYEHEDEKARQGIFPVADPLFAGYAARRATHIKKLAMVLSVSHSDSLIIEPEDFHKALSLLEKAEEKMPSAFTGVGRAKHAEETEMVARFIEDHPGCSKGEILSAMYRTVDHEALESVMKGLLTMGRVVGRVTDGEIRYKGTGRS